MRRKTAELETKDDEFNRRKYRAWLEASRLPDTIFYKGCGEEGNGPGCGGGGGGCNPDLMDCGSSGGSPSDPSAGSSGFCDASGDCSGIYDSSDNGGQGGYVGGVSGNSNPIGATSPLDEFNAGVARYLSIMRTGWDPELQVQYYEYSFAGGDGTTLEKQKELAAIQLGETKCAGQDPSTVASCIQQAYNTMGIATDKDGKPLLVGGNYNFNYSTVSINGEGIDPKQLGCATLGQQTRCGVIDSLHFHDGTGTFHVDTGNAWFFPVGTMAHFGWDIIGGNTVWRQGGIPRPWWQ
jgi:hypothetical protein